jgi:hypothetical protein
MLERGAPTREQSPRPAHPALGHYDLRLGGATNVPPRPRPQLSRSCTSTVTFPRPDTT